MGKTFHESKASLDLRTSFEGNQSCFVPDSTVSPFTSPTSFSPSPSEPAKDEVDEVEGVNREVVVPHNFSISSPGGALVDPIFQDLKPITRYYLDYCQFLFNLLPFHKSNISSRSKALC